MPPAHARRYASPSYANPPLPVLVTQRELPRAVAVTLIGMVAAVWLALQLDAIYASDGKRTDFVFPKVGYFLIAYKVLMVVSRYIEHGTYIVYEALWGCNVALVLVALAVFLSKPFLVGVAMAIVSGDQLLWFIDILSLVLTRKSLTGAVKYLTYPENRTFSKTFFASHHLWFLPLCFWLTVKFGGMHEASFMASCAVTTFLAVYCRATTPFEAKVPGSDHIIYLNINGAFEFWKDIHIGVLHALDHRHPALYLPYLAVVGNLIANGLPHILLMGISLTLQHHPMLQGWARSL